MKIVPDLYRANTETISNAREGQGGKETERKNGDGYRHADD